MPTHHKYSVGQLSVDSGGGKPKLENVTEWLNKSFDQSAMTGGGVGATMTMTTADGDEDSGDGGVVTVGKYKSTQYLLNGTNTAQKQHRSHSVAVAAHRQMSIAPDEPLIEINMNRQLYFQSSRASQRRDTDHELDNNQLQTTTTGI